MSMSAAQRLSNPRSEKPRQNKIGTQSLGDRVTLCVMCHQLINKPTASYAELQIVNVCSKYHQLLRGSVYQKLFLDLYFQKQFYLVLVPYLVD